MTPSPQESAELRSRDEFENFWRASMNVETFDLYRFGKDQYACHETNRAWMTWQAARRYPAGEGAEPFCLECSDQITALDPGLCGTCHAEKHVSPPSPPVAEGWVSAQDRRKPKPGEMVLLHVRTLHHGWDDEGNERDQEGAEVAMGEYRQGASSEMSYFDCYTSPMSDNDWITHWMPLPPPPALTKAGNEKKGD